MTSLESVFNHLVLPVKLPDHADPNPEAVSGAILTRLSKACEALRTIAGDESAGEWASILRSLRMCHGIRQKCIEAKVLLQDWAHLEPRELLILRIAEQNAAFLLYRVDRQVQ